MNAMRLQRLPEAAEALPGRSQPIATAAVHHVNGRSLRAPWPAGTAEQRFLSARGSQEKARLRPGFFVPAIQASR